MLVYCLTRDHELAAAIETRLLQSLAFFYNDAARLHQAVILRQPDVVVIDTGAVREEYGDAGLGPVVGFLRDRVPLARLAVRPNAGAEWLVAAEAGPGRADAPRRARGLRGGDRRLRGLRAHRTGPMRPGGQQRTDHPPAQVPQVDRTEGARVGACLRRVTSQLGAARRGVDQPDALDQLARRLPRVGGEHDLAGARAAAPVGQALDEQAIPGEQRRGHRAAAHFDQVEPSASRHGRCPDGGQRAQDKEKGPSRAPLRRHRSWKVRPGVR